MLIYNRLTKVLNFIKGQFNVASNGSVHHRQYLKPFLTYFTTQCFDLFTWRNVEESPTYPLK